MFRPRNNRAWLGVLPVLLIVAFSAVIPLMTVVNYSVQDILDFNSRFFVGLDWYRDTLADERFRGAFLRQVAFSLTVLAIEIPLGIAVAKGVPRSGRWTALILILLALPLLIPWNVIGTIWQIFARPDIGLLGVSVNALGIDYNYTAEPLHAWLTLVAMDVWHWTSLVALLAFAGLTAIPPAYYQAAEIDGASNWQLFRLVELPRLRNVLIIGVLFAPDGQLHDLHRALRAHRRRTRECHDFPQPAPGDHGGRSVRPRPRGGILRDLLPVHPVALLALLYQRGAPR